MKTADLVRSMQNAPELQLRDVLLTKEESAEYRRLCIHTILRIIVANGGSTFTTFKDDISKILPVTSKKIPLHKSELYVKQGAGKRASINLMFQTSNTGCTADVKKTACKGGTTYLKERILFL